MKVIKLSLGASAFSFSIVAAGVSKNKTSLTTNVDCPALFKIPAKNCSPNIFGISKVDCSNNLFGICFKELYK